MVENYEGVAWYDTGWLYIFFQIGGFGREFGRVCGRMALAVVDRHVFGSPEFITLQISQLIGPPQDINRSKF